METATMGKALTEATIENLRDLWAADQGLIPPDQVRRITVTDALVDSGATLLSLPTRLIRQLGLTKTDTKRVRSTTHVVQADVYGTVRLTIQGRQCPTDVIEVADEIPVLIGQIPLEYLDFVVDVRNQRLIGNPDHGGEHMFDLF
jgi:predicted aspartyl protease